MKYRKQIENMLSGARRHLSFAETVAINRVLNVPECGILYSRTSCCKLPFIGVALFVSLGNDWACVGK
jgi:hypothetical protein